MWAAAETTPLAGLLVIRPACHRDDRGELVEVYSQRGLAALGIRHRFVQDNQSRSRAGVLRGLHFQRRRPQAKLIRALTGRVFDVAVDLRPGSPTFGRWHGELLDAAAATMVYVPAGFGHGFLALEPAAVEYKCSAYHDPDDQGGVRWDDPRIAVAWPLAGRPPILSPRDRALPLLDQLERSG